MEGFVVFSYIVGLLLVLAGLINVIPALFMPGSYDYLGLDPSFLQKKRRDDRNFGFFLIFLGVWSAIHWVLAIIALVVVIVLFVID